MLTLTHLKIRRKITPLSDIRTLLLASLILISYFTPVYATNPADVKEKWHTPFDLYLSPKEAHEMKIKQPEKVMLIDVRTRAELKYVGMATLVDANIPIRTLDPDYRWIEKSQTFGTNPNKDFVSAMERFLKSRNLDKSATIILMCQSGSRVPIAARALHKAGYQKVYTQHEGFEGIKAKEGANKGQRVINGWKNAKLPWSYKLNPKAMYFNYCAESNNKATHSKDKKHNKEEKPFSLGGCQ